MATYKRIYKGQLAASSTSLYTPPSGKAALIKGIRIVNTDSVVRWARLGLDGTTDADLLLGQLSLDPSDFAADDGLIVLEDTQSIYGRGEVASKLTVSIFGVVMP